MRVALLITVFVPAVLLADQPKVTAPISPADVQEICALVRTVTPETVSAISKVTTPDYVPGVAPEHALHIPEKGEAHDVVVYPRRDRVYVFTNPARKDLMPFWLDIEKVNDKWTIIKKGRMVE
jgi:hypothetical protein